MMNRLSARERILVAVVVGTLLVIGNLVLISSLVKRHKKLALDYANGQTELATLRQVVATGDLWAKRDAWLTAKQPKLENRSRAGVELLEQVKLAAKTNDVLLGSQEINEAGDTQPSYQSISVEVKTQSSWAALVKFFHTLQQPDQFIVFESASIQIDSSDPTRMQGQFRIAKWYAPGTQGGGN